MRRAVTALVIGSFTLAALLGVVALLGGDAYSETQGQVLMTTTVVGLATAVVLCLLTVVGHPAGWIAVVGGIAVAIATTSALLLTWGHVSWASPTWELWSDTCGVSSAVAATSAHLALLVSITRRPGARHLSGLMWATGLVAAAVGALLIGPILDDSFHGEAYWRALGVLTILDALGTVVLIALGLFGRSALAAAGSLRPPATAPQTPPEARLQLTSEQQERLVRWAVAHRTTPDVVLAEALEAHLLASD